MIVEQRHHGEKAASATRVFCTAFRMFVKGLDTPFPKSCLHGAPFPKSCLQGAGGNLFVLRLVFLACSKWGRGQATGKTPGNGQ